MGEGPNAAGRRPLHPVSGRQPRLLFDGAEDLAHPPCDLVRLQQATRGEDRVGSAFILTEMYRDARMSATIIITETGVKEEMGRTLDMALDNNVNYPVTDDQLRAYVALGGRLDPSVESMRLKGGVHVANLNRAITTDERHTAPYQHMFWDSMKRTDRYLEFPIVTSALRPDPVKKPV
eukprot:jgi/Mesvir1/10917/Mv11459-RA.1